MQCLCTIQQLIIHRAERADIISLIQFFKQGPAYKKVGPDPNKGSNQQ